MGRDVGREAHCIFAGTGGLRGESRGASGCDAENTVCLGLACIGSTLLIVVLGTSINSTFQGILIHNLFFGGGDTSAGPMWTGSNVGQEFHLLGSSQNFCRQLCIMGGVAACDDGVSAHPSEHMKTSPPSCSDGGVLGWLRGSAELHLKLRKAVRDALMTGKVPRASQLLAQSCPQALAYSPNVGIDVPFYLDCLHFIELVR